MELNAKALNWLIKVGCAVVASFGAAALPAQAARVNVVHGIDGRDLGATRDLPVDIAVNGACSLKGVQFTQQAVVQLGAGSYRITVHPADGTCSSTAVIDKTITIGADDEQRKYTAVASLTAAKVPQLAVFESQRLGAIIGVRHFAAAGPILVEGSITDYKRLGRPIKTRLKNGQEGPIYAVWARRLRYRVDIKTGSQRDRRRLEGRVTDAQRNLLIVGSLKNGLTIISEDVR